ncbi:tetratricopeptide repeat protein [Sphingobium sp. CR28]|uniref:tetratricopeptide repeat protein n=1 Tax=Sphingobium sp. CR28 TaxID=3400272 RepID=UPI003FF148F5
MTGLFIAMSLAVAALALLYLFARIPLRHMLAPATAILVGLAGYAWQGQPALPEQTPDAAKRLVRFDERLADRRKAMSDRLGPANSWIILSDGLARQGNSIDAANALTAGLRQYPRDPALWVALGNALMIHTQGVMSPAADYAFRQAERFSPRYAVAPRYFYGLAMAQAGRMADARKLWLGLVMDLPEDHPLRFELARNLMIIDAMEKRQGGEQPQSGATGSP